MLTIYQRAIRFADLWALDHHQMVDEVYAPTIHMESMGHLDHAPVECGDDLHQLETRLAAMIPQHRHELVRVLGTETHACLETTVVSPTTGEYAPACVWWWMADNGQVDEEVGFFEWDRRTTDTRASHGFIPAPDGGDFDDDKVLLDALRTGELSAHVGPQTVVEAVGVGPCDVSFGEVEVQEFVVDGPVVAALVVGRNGGRVWRGTVVMTASAEGLISVRCYNGPSTAVDVAAIHPRMNLRRQPTAG